jgi:hypothetical protein
MVNTSVAQNSINPITNFHALLTSPQWPHYLRCLNYFLKYSPSSYFPIELIRFDKLPFDEIKKQVITHGNDWLRIYKNESRYKTNHEEKISISKAALYDLYKLLQRTKKEHQIYGGRSDVLELFPIETRLSLTPLDNLFKSNIFYKELKKIMQKAGLSEWNAFTFDSDNQIIILERSTSLDRPKLNFPIALINIKNLTNSNDNFNNKITFQVTSLQKKETLPNFQINTSYLRGNFFQSDKNNPYPFGKFVDSKEVFLDEKGEQHFGGDGHNHSH